MNIQKMMKQAQDMQSKLAKLQAELDVREIEGIAGGGAVKITLTGKGNAIRSSIDASVIDPNDKEMLEDLITAAINDARGKIDSTFTEEMGKVTSGLNLPPGMKLPF